MIAAYTTTIRSVLSLSPLKNCFTVYPHMRAHMHDDSCVLVSMQGALGDGDLMLICIAPDHEGKFGFNVKVGPTLTLFVCLLPSLHKA